MEKKTPLYDLHVKLGGKMVEYAGYLLPVQYEGISKEHNAVRNSVGVFDASHMGEFMVEGANAAEFLDYLLTNRVSNMPINAARYSPMCNEKGGVVDDLLVFRFSETLFCLIVNASNKEKDFAHIKSVLHKGVQLRDVSDITGLIAVQGKSAEALIKKLAKGEIPTKNYTFTNNVDICGSKVLLSRTGYTGEDGFEIYTPWNELAKVFEAIYEAGKEFNLTPCGLGARDTLRLEAGMPLYGHEMSENITPLETGLGVFVKLDKPDFIGKKALETNKPRYKRIGLELVDKGIAREDCLVFANGKKVGLVSSGTLSPYSGKAVLMALVDVDTPLDAAFTIDVRGRMLAAKTAKLPFYKKSN